MEGALHLVEQLRHIASDAYSPHPSDAIVGGASLREPSLTPGTSELVTVKNRKLRQMAQLYPEVNVRVLYRRDVFSLLGKYLPEATARLAG